MLEIKPFDAWAEANATTDPSEKIKQYADYVRTNAYKNGQLDETSEQEIQQGMYDRAIVDGLIAEDEPEADKNLKLQGLLTPTQNKDADAKFLLDYYQTDFAADSSEYSQKAPTIQKYLSLKQVSPDKIGDLQGIIDGYLDDKSAVKSARLSAVDRGDYRVVSVEEEGGRQLYTGADTKPENLNGELDSLISNGAISPSDLRSVKELMSPINGGKSTVAEGTRYSVFDNTVRELAKKDPALRSSLDQEAARIREAKRESQMTTGESIFEGIKEVVAVPFDALSNVITSAFGLSHPEEQAPAPSELIANNKAITSRFSNTEVDKFLGDFLKHQSGPVYRADRPETGIDVDSLGSPIVSPALIANKAQFEKALSMASLNDDQKERATIGRQAALETEAPKILKLILGESSEAASSFAQAKSAGKTDAEFVEEWVGNNSQNYDGMSERLQQLGMSTFSALATLPAGIGALMGFEPAAKALVAMNKEQSDREEYARLFGDEFGLGFQLVNTIPQVATDILATIGTTGLYTAAKGVARGGAKAITREALRGAVSMVDDTTAVLVKDAAKAGGESLVSTALKEVGDNLAVKLSRAEQLVPLFATTFTRSASSTYGSIYGQLPDTMSHDEKHQNAFGYGIAAGLSTAVITAGMSFLGNGGVEDLATGKFRPATLADETATNVRKVPLSELNYKQAKFLYENLENAGAKLSDGAFKKVLRTHIGGEYKNYLRTVIKGGGGEGFEEALDTAIQGRIEDAALDKNTPISERVNQIFTAFTLGGILGSAVPAVSQITAPLQQSEISLALDARASVLTKVANDLRKTGSSATAEVLQRQLNDAQAAANSQKQLEIAAQQQKEERVKFEEVVTNVDKPISFEPVVKTAPISFDPTGQAELPIGDTRSMVLPETTRFLTDFEGERAYVGSYAGTLERVGDAVHLNLDEPRADGVTHLVVGNKFQPIDKSGVRLDRKRLMVTGEHRGSIPAGTPYVAPNPKNKQQFALPPEVENVSLAQDMADAPVLRIKNARLIGQENILSDIILTDKGQIEDALRYYNLEFAELSKPENTQQLELGLFDEPPVVEPATTPVADPTAVITPPTPIVVKGRGRKTTAIPISVDVGKPMDVAATPAEVVIADAEQTGITPPTKPQTEEGAFVSGLIKESPLALALLDISRQGYSAEAINNVAQSFTPEDFADLQARIDTANNFASGLDDALSGTRQEIFGSLNSMQAIYDRVRVAQFTPAKAPVVVPEVIAEETPLVVEPTTLTPAPKKPASKKKVPVTPLPSAIVVDNEENPTEVAAKLQEELSELATTVPVFDADGRATTLESLEVELLQLDGRVSSAKETGRAVPSSVLDSLKRLRSSVDQARALVGEASSVIENQIKELSSPDPDVDIRTDQQRNADDLLDIMEGRVSPSPDVAAKAAAVEAAKSRFKEKTGVGPTAYIPKQPPIAVYKSGLFRNTVEAQLFTEWAAGGYMISNFAEHGFDPRAVSGIPFQAHSTEIKQRLFKAVTENFPLIPVAKGTTTVKSNVKVPNMDAAGSSYIDLPVVVDTEGTPVAGVFTNNPLVTMQQIDKGLRIIIPKSIVSSKGFSLNPSIITKSTQKGGLEVIGVKRHPNDTGVNNAGDVSLVGKSGYTPKKAMTSLGGLLREPAPQFLNGAGPSARNKANNTFETYMNDMMSVSSSNMTMAEEDLKRSNFGSFERLITNSFGLSEDKGREAMSVAQVAYANSLKEYGLGKKIENSLIKAQQLNPSATLFDINIPRIILEEATSKGQVTPPIKDVANTLKKIYGKTAESPEGELTNYGVYLYNSVTSGEMSVGVKPFRTQVRDSAKRYQISEIRRNTKMRGNSAVSQEDYDDVMNSLIDPNTDVVESAIRLLDTSTLNQLAETLRVNTNKAYDSLFKIVSKSIPNLNEDMDEVELIDLAGHVLNNYQKEEGVKLARDLKSSPEGLDLANALIDMGWLPPVEGEILTPKGTSAIPTQLEPLPEKATQADKKKRLVSARKLARESVGVYLSEADGDMLAATARKVNNAEIKRLGIVSNDPASVIAALRDIQESGTPMQRLVVGVLTANVDLIRNVRFTIGDMNDVRFAGAFMPKSNLVVINISGHNGRGVVDVLLHEYLHAVTIQTMTNPKTPAQIAAMQRIASLRNLTAVQAEKMGFDTEGFTAALTDDLEFITHALTAPEFQSLIRAATPTGQRSLLSRIWESLRALFGFGVVDKKMASAFDELLDFTQMFAGANTFNIKSERNLRLDARKIEEGLSALREFAKVKGQLRSNSNVLISGRRSFLDDLDAELQSEIYGGYSAKEKRIRESVAYAGKTSRGGVSRTQGIEDYSGPELPTTSGWLSPKGKFFSLDPSDTGLSASFGTHQQKLLDILISEHSEEELDAVLSVLGFNNIYDLSENDAYLIGYELGYARILDAGDEIYAEKWSGNRGKLIPKALTPAQTSALKIAGKMESKTIMRDGVTTPLYVATQSDYMNFSLGSNISGEVAINVVAELNSQLPEGVYLTIDGNLKGEAGVRRSQPNVIYVNPELLANRVAGLSEDAARASIKGLVNHELAHFAALNSFTPAQIKRVASELSEDQLQRTAEEYYATSGLTAEEILTTVVTDRESGILSDERIADEWIRMQVEKAASGRTYEDIIKATKGNSTLLATVVDAIKAFVVRLRQRFAEYPSTETAASISHAARALRKINKSKSIDFNADIYAEGRFGDTANFFASLDGSPVEDQVSYAIPVMSSNEGKVDAMNERLRLYNLPSQLRDIVNLRNGTVNQITAASKSLVKYFPKLRDNALKGGVDMEDIKILFGTTAPPLTNADLKEISDLSIAYEATIPDTETEGRKADLVAEHSEKLKRERRLRFNEAFVKRQQAAEQNIRDAGFRELVDRAVLFRKDINKFKGDIGFDESNDVYLTRAYKFFNTEGWAAAAKMGGIIKIEGKDVDFNKLRMNAASAYYEESEAEFQKIGKPYTSQDVDDLTLKKLDNYLSSLETMTSAVDRQTIDSIRKDLNRFKPKKDIDSTFRELLGEIDDPLANAVNTAFRVGMLSANDKFKTDFAKTALDLGLASKDAKAGWITSFAASSSKTTGDLAGLYFDPKVAGVINEMFGVNMKGLASNSTNIMNGVGRTIMGVSGAAIQMKTQLGFGYWPRNVIGGYILSAAQGILMNPFSAKGSQSIKQSWSGAFSALGTEEEQRDSILRLIQLNVLNDQSQGRAAQDLLRGLIATPEQDLQALMSAVDEARITKDAGGVVARLKVDGYITGGLAKAYSGYSKVTDFLAALDGAIDGMFKANAYYYELGIIQKHFGDTMSVEAQEEAAARKVKLTFAGHSQVIDIVKSFNKTPMAAVFLPFARWKSEVFRTMLNTVPLALEEIKQGGVMARRGMQRLAGFTATVTAAPVIVGTLMTTFFRALTGGEEEERELTAVELAALRESLPKWQRGHQIRAQVLKGGKVQMIDMSYVLPHSQLTDAVSIITEGFKTGEGINGSRLASYVVNDLIGTQIAATSLDEILNNENDRGQPIYLETDNSATVMMRTLAHFGKGVVVPSGAAKFIDITRKGQTNAEELIWGEILGSRPKTNTFGEIERRGFRNLKGLLDDSVSTIGELTSGRFKTDKEIDEIVDRHQDGLNETQRRMNRFMRSMVSMGSEESSVYASAKIYKFSDDTIGSAYQGYRVAWKPNDKWNQKTYFNAEQAKEQDGMQKIQSINRSVNRKGAVYYVNGPYDE